MIISLYYIGIFTLFTSVFFIFSYILSNLFDLKRCVFKCPKSFHLLSIWFHSCFVPYSVRGPEQCDLSVCLVNISQ